MVLVRGCPVQQCLNGSDKSINWCSLVPCRLSHGECGASCHIWEIIRDPVELKRGIQQEDARHESQPRGGTGREHFLNVYFISATGLGAVHVPCLEVL